MDNMQVHIGSSERQAIIRCQLGRSCCLGLQAQSASTSATCCRCRCPTSAKGHHAAPCPHRQASLKARSLARPDIQRRGDMLSNHKDVMDAFVLQSDLCRVPSAGEQKNQPHSMPLCSAIDTAQTRAPKAHFMRSQDGPLSGPNSVWHKLHQEPCTDYSPCTHYPTVRTVTSCKEVGPPPPCTNAQVPPIRLHYRPLRKRISFHEFDIRWLSGRFKRNKVVGRPAHTVTVLSPLIIHQNRHCHGRSRGTCLEGCRDRGRQGLYSHSASTARCTATPCQTGRSIRQCILLYGANSSLVFSKV